MAVATGVREKFFRGDGFVFGAGEEGGKRLDETRRIVEGSELIERELKDVPAKKHELLGLREDARIRRYAQPERVLADQLIAEGVEGVQGNADSVRDKDIDPFLHFPGRFVGKGEGEDFLRLGALREEQPGDAPGDDGGLPGPGAGDDKQRPALMEHGGTLGRRQILKEDSAVLRGKGCVDSGTACISMMPYDDDLRPP